MLETDELTRDLKGIYEDDGKSHLDIGEYVKNSEKKENTILEDIIKTTKSGAKKALSFIKHPIGIEDKTDGNSKKGFLKGLNDAGITPNNIVTFRTFVLMPMGITLFAAGQRELSLAGLIILITSCILDAVDGAIARKFNKKSINGELYDAGGDKITEIGISSLVTVILTLSDVELGILYGLLTGIKTYQHYKSQTRTGRPKIKEQAKIFYDSALKEENTQFIEKKSDSAATLSGKIKTALQFTSSLGILGVSTINSYFDLGNIKNVSNYILLGVGGISLIFGYLSKRNKK